MNRNIFLCLGITAAVFSFNSGFAACQLDSNPISYSKLDEKKWVEACLQTYPEISWLASEHVKHTEEGKSANQGSYSKQLFGQQYVEFDRTLLSLKCLNLILDGSREAYLAFVAAQPQADKLTPCSFKVLHQKAESLLKSAWGGLSEKQMVQALETALVLGDIGKSEKARELFKPYGISAPDHDDFHGEVMEKQPLLCPSFSKLPSSAQQLLKKSSNLAHYGHITHLEGGPEMFKKIKESRLASKDTLPLAFDLFIHACDVAGALGHVNQNSSLAYTEHTHRPIHALGAVVKPFGDPHYTEWNAYEVCLFMRNTWLGFSTKEPSNRVLARVGAMLRLSTPSEGIILKKAMAQLDASDRKRIHAQLDMRKEASNEIMRTPTYMPAVLINLANNTHLGSTKEKRLYKAIKIGLPFIARVLEKQKERIANGEADPQVPLNFNKMAAVAKTAPEQLEKEFEIDPDGIIKTAQE